MIKADPRHSTYLATALMMRGGATISDINRNITRLKPKLNMIYWNKEGFKLGICSKPPVGLPYSLLALANNTCIARTFDTMLQRFDKLYKRKLFVHHYEEYMDKGNFDVARNTIATLRDEYDSLNRAQPQPVVKMRPKGTSFV